MQEKPPDTAIRALVQHQRRREEGIPCLSVLVGSPELAVVTWRSWAHSCSLRSFVIRSSGKDIAERVAAEWMVQPWILNRLGEHIAPALGTSAKTVCEVLGGGPSQERSVLRERVIAASSNRGLESLCQRILADDQEEATAASGSAGWIEGLSLIEGKRAPGFLLVTTGEPEESARNLADLMERCPRVPLGWAVPGAVYAGLTETKPFRRIQTLCREGFVSVPGRPGAGGADALTLRYEEALAAREKTHEGPEAAESARSAAEAFLFHVLESLPETGGLFELNGRIAAEWGPQGRAEVDLLCRSRRLAVEVDGYYHFLDPDGFRRDRRKDVLLQQHGYLVLRFLAEDVVSRLETILDTISSALRWCEDRNR